MFLFATATFLYQIWQDHRRDHRNDQYQRSDRNHSFDSFIIKIHCFHLFKFSYPMGILGYILKLFAVFLQEALLTFWTSCRTNRPSESNDLNII